MVSMALGLSVFERGYARNASGAVVRLGAFQTVKKISTKKAKTGGDFFKLKYRQSSNKNTAHVDRI